MEDISDIACSENSSSNEPKKSNKPLMEKRRRARINACLSQLKSLVLEAMKKDTSRYSKLEKADILEMTVKHLRNIQRQQMTSAINTDPAIISKYRAGFNECLGEVNRYIQNNNGMNQDIKLRLIDHLAGCVQPPTQNGLSPDLVSAPQVFQIPNNVHVTHAELGLQGQGQMSTLQGQSVLRIAPTTIVAAKPTNTVQLIPGTLQNGEVAYLVPSSTQNGFTSTQNGFVSSQNGFNTQNNIVSLNAQNCYVPNNSPNSFINNGAQNYYVSNNINNVASMVSNNAHSYNQPSRGMSISPQAACEAPLPRYQPSDAHAIDNYRYQRDTSVSQIRPQTMKAMHMQPRVDSSLKRDDTMWRPW